MFNWNASTLAILAFGLLAIMLAGCSGLPKDAPVTSTTPVCKALIGPIKTNSSKPESKRYLPPSSTALRGDIKQRNQVGENLGCPQYR